MQALRNLVYRGLMWLADRVRPRTPYLSWDTTKEFVEPMALDAADLIEQFQKAHQPTSGEALRLLRQKRVQDLYNQAIANQAPWMNREELAKMISDCLGSDAKPEDPSPPQ